MDTRGQGWAPGGASGTADWAPEAGMIHTPGFLTAGLASPDSYYYRRVFCDALRLLEVAAALEQTDADRVIVTGASQGGGITIAVAGLAGPVRRTTGRRGAGRALPLPLPAGGGDHRERTRTPS